MKGPSLYRSPAKAKKPIVSGLGATTAKGGVKSGFDVDDVADLKEQNKAKKAELLKQYRAKEISADEYHSDLRELETYESPE